MGKSVGKSTVQGARNSSPAVKRIRSFAQPAEFRTISMPCEERGRCPMKILIYKRTHVGDPDNGRTFGNQDCMGRLRRLQFEAVIGVGGVSAALPRKQGLAKKLNCLGRNPVNAGNGIRGPLVSFAPSDYRLFENQGPLLRAVAPRLAKRVYGSRARFFFTSLSAAEQREARRLISYVLDSGKFDHLQPRQASTHGARSKSACDIRLRCKPSAPASMMPRCQ